jgi:type IV secretory pathway TraG/TraD family ATPase VirD4
LEERPWRIRSIAALPDDETLREIEYRSGRTSVMVRGFNVSSSQVAGSGDNLVEQARPLLQAEDIRALTGGELGLLEARDSGFFSVEYAGILAPPGIERLSARRAPEAGQI